MSPRTKKEFEEIRKDSKQNIVKTAMELFAEKGFHATSINAIADKANISKGLLYHYFKSKYELLDAIVFEAFEETDSLLDFVETQEYEPIEMIVKLAEMTFESLEKKTELWKLLTGMGFKKHIRTRYKELIENKKVKYLQFGMDLIQKMNVKDPQGELLFISAIIDGMALHYLDNPKEYPKEMMINTFKKNLKLLYK